MSDFHVICLEANELIHSFTQGSMEVEDLVLTTSTAFPNPVWWHSMQLASTSQCRQMFQNRHAYYRSEHACLIWSLKF